MFRGGIDNTGLRRNDRRRTLRGILKSRETQVISMRSREVIYMKQNIVRFPQRFLVALIGHIRDKMLNA